ncbi:uncharacterized protein LOC128986286 [Macrosteles quadrilineatus]|uniref:uncharacterized protein LOC128986286 n=1 Tax=Macrosteles quadrilineatus TaxID=74068 RepID=UPI0023E24A09|nr:uncharacterized protein LOC128986286 [Macrosteles quadrilineatus]
MVTLGNYVAVFLALCLIKTVVTSPPSEGKEIADRLGDDLSFASKQLIRGFTAIFAPIFDTLQRPPGGLSKAIPIPGGGNAGIDNAAENFRRVLLRDGVNAIGKGVKAGATIISTPARVAGTGLEEAIKVSEAAGISPRKGANSIKYKTSQVPPGNIQSNIEDGTKIASTLLNTTASEFSQANLGAVLVEVALKNRIKDIGNKTANAVQSRAGPKVEAKEIDKREDPDSSNKGDQPPAPSRVDDLLERFNEAVRQNDERVLTALRGILAQINPPKN